MRSRRPVVTRPVVAGNVVFVFVCNVFTMYHTGRLVYLFFAGMSAVLRDELLTILNNIPGVFTPHGQADPRSELLEAHCGGVQDFLRGQEPKWFYRRKARTPKASAASPQASATSPSDVQMVLLHPRETTLKVRDFFNVL